MIDFLSKHKACCDGFSWACENCESMDQVWETVRPDWLVWLATRRGVLTDRELHEFAWWCAQQVEHLLTDERSRNALKIKRLWLDGKATDEEIDAAYDAAIDAAYFSDRVSSAAHVAACAAAHASNPDESYSAYAADYVTSRSAQAEWLRKNTKPKFEL